MDINHDINFKIKKMKNQVIFLVSSKEENSLNQISSFFTLDNGQLEYIKGGNAPIICRKGYSETNFDGVLVTTCKCGYKS